MTEPRGKGYSLTELLCVLAVAGILAALASGSLRQSSLRANRVEATQALLSISLAQEHWRLERGSYASTLGSEGLGLKALTWPDGHFRLAIVGDGATAYQATASATGGQARDSRCRYFSIDESGARFAGTSAEGMNEPACWSGGR